VRITLIVVCHHSSSVVSQCVTSFRRVAAQAGAKADVVVVEQSDDVGEVEAVAGMGVDRSIVRPNRGYAAGLNAGIDAATGDVVVLANPDLIFLDGSLTAMLRALDAGFDVVGPQFVWDTGGTCLLPAAEDPAPRAELWRTLRRRWQQAWSGGLPGCLQEIWRVWAATGPVEVPSLRGALLVAPRAAIERFGRFDEGYFLYYEETEWLWRARRRGARLALAADAGVVHRWGHATARRSDRSVIEEASRRRFFQRNYGASWRLLLEICAGGEQRAGVSAQTVAGPAEVPETMADLWLVSPFPHLLPAGGAVRRASLPDCVRELAGHGRWFSLAAIRQTGEWRAVGSWTWDRP
jgi:GT2 family glycosyltransferase